jgi:hypothetical protein
MDKVSKLVMALKSPEYLEHIDNLSRNVPNLKQNIEFSRGNVYLEMSMKGKKKAIVFPRYQSVSQELDKLVLQRDPLYARYRFLRNKIIHSDKVSHDVFSEYDKIIKQLSEIDTDIEVLETYKRVITNDTNKQRETAKDSKTTLLKELQESDSTIKYINNLKRIKEVDETLSNTHETSVDFYIVSMPKMMTIEKEKDDEEEEVEKEKEKEKDEKKAKKPKKEKKEPKEPTVGDKECKKPCREDQICNKKTGRCIKKPKVTKGGSFGLSFVDDDKIKNIVKKKIKNIYIDTRV